MGGRASNTTRTYKNKGFPTDTVQYHFNRHGKDFGAKNAREYEKLAIKFKDTKSNKDIKEFIHRETGNIYKYNYKTNDYIVYRNDGYIRTFYKPTGKERYFENKRRQYADE